MNLMLGWNMRSAREVIMLNPRKRNSKEQKLLMPDRSHSRPYTIESYFKLHHPVPNCRRESIPVWYMCSDFKLVM